MEIFLPHPRVPTPLVTPLSPRNGRVSPRNNRISPIPQVS